MTIENFEYDSDTSLPDEFKNTNHLNPIDAEASDSDTDSNNKSSNGQGSIPDIDFQGFTADYKGNQRRRAQLAQKSRTKATQSYIQKKTKQIEDKDRLERKQEQKKKGADQQLEEGEEEEAGEDTISHSMASININAADSSSESESDREQESTSSRQRRSRGKKSGKNHKGETAKEKGKESSRSGTRSKSRNGTKVEGENKQQGYDVIDRSNKRADRHRRPEDENLEPSIATVADASDNEVDQALEEDEKIRFKHNLNFKTDEDDAMAARPLNSRDWKQIFSQKLQERDQARERQKEKERNQA
ncbi:hypothetical protein BGX26_006914 [Mortierella sp. AD094]|nr:hypothetical protein BGX26_006914 [Mortierella sp. AD094]